MLEVGVERFRLGVHERCEYLSSSEKSGRLLYSETRSLQQVVSAADLAVSELLSDLLAQSRGFGLAVTLAMQFPGQLREADPTAYAELMNNVSTLVTGNVAVDATLQQRLATDDDDADAVGNRLRALSRGEWLVSLPAPFGTEEPRPFLVESLPLPPGHPEGNAPLSQARQVAFEAELELARYRTATESGLPVEVGVSATEMAPAAPGADRSSPGPVTSTLPYTRTFPGCIEYDSDAHAVACGACHRRYGASLDGLLDAVACCAGLDRLDREDVPIVDIPLTMTAAKRAASEYSDRQLAFLQAVYTAQHGGYDPDWEYDLLRDSMTVLASYVGIERPAIDALVEDGLLRHDTDRPYRLYTVSPDGRDEIDVAHREGVSHGPGIGDLNESSHHVLMVEAAMRYVEQTYVTDPDSAVVEVVGYHQVGANRLDAAGLDADGEVVLTVEAERHNHDLARAVLADYDAIAALEPETALWVFDSRATAHAVVDALYDPLVGEQRIEKTYSENTPPSSFRFDTPGWTETFTVEGLLNRIQE